MFNRKRKDVSKRVFSDRAVPAFMLEPLEDRRLLSGSQQGFGGGHAASTILFSQAPAAVQTGLEALATTDGLTAPTSASTDTVYLRNVNGVETYTLDITSTGTTTQLTVNQKGNPVTAPANSTTTFGAISNTAVTSEISAIATALSLTAPTSTQSVKVSTPANGVATYTIRLAGSATGFRGATISVDANGNPVGNESIPLSTLPTAIQNGLTSNAPAGATALTSSSLVRVATNNGVTTYSATYAATGTQTVVTVDATGALADLPSTSSTTFGAIPQAAQTELQTLATADGVTTAISTSQTVTVYDEANGTTIYSVTVTAPSSSGSTQTYNLTLSVDANGNPTVPPQGGGRDGGGCGIFGGSGFVSSGSSGSNFGGFSDLFLGRFGRGF